MTVICYVGIEVSANFQKALLGIELTMLLVLSVWALVKVGNGSAPVGHLTPSLSWFNPFKISSASAFINGVLLMLFIYWGWDTTVSVNEETADPHTVPGRAAVLSTLVLLVTYVLVVLSTQSYAGIGTTGIGLGNPANQGDVLSVLGHSVFGTSTLGNVLSHLLLLMVLSSAAASTQTTILPTARTTLAMGVYRAIPSAFARIHRRFLTPTVSTVVMGVASIVLYVVMNYISAGSVIADAVSALGVMIAFYYGLTGFSCAWYYRSTLTDERPRPWIRGILPVLGGVMLWGALGYNLYFYWGPGNSATSWHMPFWPHWDIGGVFLIDLISLVIGIVLMVAFAAVAAGLLPGRDPQSGHAHPGPRGHRRPKWGSSAWTRPGRSRGRGRTGSTDAVPGSAGGSPGHDPWENRSSQASQFRGHRRPEPDPVHRVVDARDHRNFDVVVAEDVRPGPAHPVLEELQPVVALGEDGEDGDAAPVDGPQAPGGGMADTDGVERPPGPGPSDPSEPSDLRLAARTGLGRRCSPPPGRPAASRAAG